MKNEILNKICSDPKLSSKKELVVVDLNALEDVMLQDAYLLTADRKVKELCCETSSSGIREDEAEIKSCEDGTILVSYHLARRNSKTGRCNGIRFGEEDEMNVETVVFANVGQKRLTVEKDWVDPGNYVVFEEISGDDPEFRKAVEAFLQRPEVQEDIAEAQRQVNKKIARGLL